MNWDDLAWYWVKEIKASDWECALYKEERFMFGTYSVAPEDMFKIGPRIEEPKEE